ncbi:MAG: FecR domain-containing protein [Phycisphaeraceae bacterium]
MNKPNENTSHDELILDLLDGNLPEYEQADLRDWLNESPEHWERFAHLSFIHGQIASQLHSQRSSDNVRLDALQAEPAEEELPVIHLSSSDGLSKQKYFSALSYMLKHTFTPNRLATLSAAAVFVGVVVTAVLLIGPGTPKPISEEPSPGFDTPITSSEAKPIVATITALNNAVWANQPSEDLSPGDRFHLLEGFVEITTRDGAVVVLEAPAIAQLINDTNALRLHHGKLIGICETHSSKGFIVHTPQLEVIDVGTRFGVAVNTAGRVVTHVYEGSVGVTPTIEDGATATPRALVTGETIVVDQHGQETVPAVTDLQAFSRLAPLVGGVARMSGQLDWADSIPFMGTDESTWNKSSRAVVFEEVRPFTLPETLYLSRAPAKDGGQVKTVAAGTTIRTYILLFNPGGPQPSVAKGSVVFDGEILGVVVGDRWNQSLLTLDGANGGKLFSADQKFGTIEYEFDSLAFLNDGHALQFKLQAGLACDAIRIVVRDPVGETQ